MEKAGGGWTRRCNYPREWFVVSAVLQSAAAVLLHPPSERCGGAINHLYDDILHGWNIYSSLILEFS